MIRRVLAGEDILDFAWALARNDYQASYPRAKSKEKLKEDIGRAVRAESSNVIACYKDEALCGVCVYFWDNEHYAQATQFLIREDYYKQVADELVDHLSQDLAGYQLHIGVPAANRKAIGYFSQKDFKCIESSFDTRLCGLGARPNQQNDCIEQITASNFEKYAVFHDKYAIPNEMYYHSGNLKKDLERFRILARHGGAIRGSIFVKVFKDGAEVFGLFIDQEQKNNGLERALINEILARLYHEFGALGEIVYFIEENSTDELDCALASGFEIRDHYRCFRRTL